jgi:hypothetical protein
MNRRYYLYKIGYIQIGKLSQFYGLLIGKIFRNAGNCLRFYVQNFASVNGH